MAAGQVCALIVAAGRGVRFGASENKVFAPVAGRPLLGWTLAAFAQTDVVDHIVIVGNDSERERLLPLASAYGGGKVREIVSGGADRQGSVCNGLQSATACACACIAIHDAARCCITPEIIAAAVEAGQQHGAVTVAVPVSDTLVRSENERLTGDDVPRDDLYAIQTPQVFARDVIVHAHETALRDNRRATDDAGLVRRLHGCTHYVDGSPENLKVTRPADLRLAEAILNKRGPGVGYRVLGETDTVTGTIENSASTTPGTQHPVPKTSPPFRVGHGYDVHSFAEGRPLWLGGVHFPDSPRGMLAHSDGDVILHALCDALLGAAGMGDIGKLFPPSDIRHKDRPSLEFLREVAARLKDAGWCVGNVDITVLAEFPKIGPRSGDMKREISVVLGITLDVVSIKATTNEGMGFVGRGEGIAVHATALLYR